MENSLYQSLVNHIFSMHWLEVLLDCQETLIFHFLYDCHFQ